MNIFVGNLDYQTSEQELNDLFSEFGTVSSVKIIKDRETGRAKGFAFVEMSEDGEAQAAISQLNESEFRSRNIVVNEARPRENSGGGGRQGGFNRDRNFNRERNFNKRY